MAAHSSVLAWRIPGTGEPGGLPSMGSHRVGQDWSDLAAAAEPINNVMTVSGEHWRAQPHIYIYTYTYMWHTHSLPGSSVHGILQARILEWVEIPFSRGSSWLMDGTGVSCIAGRFFTIWATREAGLIFKTSFINQLPLENCWFGQCEKLS